jgi:hypothetical protein
MTVANLVTWGGIDWKGLEGAVRFPADGMKLFGGEFLELSKKYAEEKRENLQDADLSQVLTGSGPVYFDNDDDDDYGDEYYGDVDADDAEETADERSAYFPPRPRGGGGPAALGVFQPPGMSEIQMSLMEQGTISPTQIPHSRF